MSLKTLAAGVIFKRAAGTAVTGLGGLISMKVLLGIFTGVALVMGITIWKQGHDLKRVNGQVTDIRTAVADAAGIPVDKLDVGQIANTVRVIKVNLATARNEAKNFKAVSATQSAAVTRLGTETAKARAQATANIKRVAQITAERDAWVSNARQRATRTKPQPAPVELKQVEDVQDALYNLGF